MTLAAALDMLAGQANIKTAVRLYAPLAADVSAGLDFSKALLSSGAWSGFAVAVVEAGEASGQLSESLAYLADEIAKSRALRGKVLGALTYPLVIAAVATVLVVALTAFIFPKILPLLSGLGVSLPWPTRALIGTSSFVRKQGLIALAIAGTAAICCTLLVRRRPRMKYRLHSGLLRLPIAGALLREWNVATISRTLGTLLVSGLPIGHAVLASANACGNMAYRAALASSSEAIDRGGTLHAALAEHPRLFPPLAVQMLAVGETSGSLPETLASLAAFYEAETDERTRTLSSLVEPVVMIVMGIAIGFVAVSIIAPIYEITGHLHAA